MGISLTSHRKSPRLACDAHAVLVRTDKHVDARLCDVSRFGVRIRLGLDALTLPERAGLADVAAAMGEYFGERIDVLMGNDRGKSVHRSLAIVRIAIPHDAPGFIDLGCMFENFLSDAEAERIGVVAPPEIAPDSSRREMDWSEVPRKQDDLSSSDVEDSSTHTREDGTVADIRESSPRTSRAAPGTRRVIARPKQRLSGRITHRAHPSRGSIGCITDTLTPHAIMVRVNDGLRLLGVEAGDGALTRAAYEFVENYGEVVQFEARGGSDPLWSGPMRVCGVEYGSDDENELVLTMMFERPLEQPEMKALGLAS